MDGGQPRLAGHISPLMPDFQEAKDFPQNVAVILLRKLSASDAQRPFTAWASGIARRALI